MSSAPLYLAIVVVWLIVLVPMLLRRDPVDPDLDLDHDGLDDDLDAADDDPDRTLDDAPRAGTATDGPGGAYRPGITAADDDDPDRTVVLRRPGAVGGPVGRAATDPDAHDDHHDRDGAGGGDIDAGGVSHGVPADDHGAVAFGRSEGLPPRPRPSRARVIARRRRRTTGLTALLAATSVAVALGLGPWWVLVPPAGLLFGHLVLLREAAKADRELRAAEQRRARHRAQERSRRAAEAAREAEIIEFTGRTDQVYDQYTDAQQRAVGD
jgi:hypothetical protein